MKEINGKILKEMLISGANHLYNNYPAIDALNVFPVPDGDTGMNMNLTVSSGAKEIANRNDTDVYEIAKAFSKGLLMGARGNSGVITSQIFRGFARALEGKKEIGPLEFADAWQSGKDVAYKAVMRPVEGTILTVVREAGQFLNDHVKKDWSMEKCFDVLLEEARASLERTPDLLPILKEVGVVDSGGAGLVTIFEGMVSALKGKIIEKAVATAIEDGKNVPTMAGAQVAQEEEYGYCTEFIMRLGGDENKRNFIDKRFSNFLNSHGTSVVFVREDDVVKVHIHTLKPGNVLNYAQQFGEFVTLKIENMTEQHSHLVEEAQNGATNIASKIEESVSLYGHTKAEEVLDSAAKKKYALIAVASGEGVKELFKKYRVDYIVEGGQTMNPSTEDFLAAIKKINAEHFYILPNNSNIIMAASQACDVLREEGKISAEVIPSKTIPQGLVACMNFNPEIGKAENSTEMNKALKTVKTGQITYAIKDTSVDGVEVHKDEFMVMNGKKILASHPDKLAAFTQLVDSMIDEESAIVTIIYGEDVKEEEIASLVEQLADEHDYIEFDLIAGGQPVYSFIIGVE
ncbi:MAG: DAK2 domain-containing protein [Bacilli bacterium]|nr:DAK2 domain-containing protein [Bacilli bacterium]